MLLQDNVLPEVPKFCGPRCAACCDLWTEPKSAGTISGEQSLCPLVTMVPA